MPLSSLHPAVRRWFVSAFSAPSKPQAEAFPAIARGENVLVAAPTGSGKTLAAFLVALDDLFRRGLEGTLDDRVHVLYVSPLRALSNDIAKNLELPLAGISDALRESGVDPPAIRIAVRTGDTPAKERALVAKKPPHLLVTTPESLYVMLTSDSGRRMLAGVRTVIVDEIHALVDDKRGAHLSLSLARLDRLAGSPQRIGLSATQRPILEVARYLVGASRIDPRGMPVCTILDSGHARALDLAIDVPSSPLETVMSNEVWEEGYDRITALANTHRTTLVFVNTRRTAERVAAKLATRLGDDAVTSHHGSLSREHRLAAEQRLKSGALRVLVATASLELGIDVGDVDLVVQIGSPRGISTFLQRVGRAGHRLAATPKGRIFPTSRDELVECVALLDAIARGELEELAIPEGPLDILAQQLVAAIAAEELRVDEAFALARSAYPYRNLSRESFDAVLAMLSEGFATARGRRGAYVHLDAVHGIARPRRAAKIAALTGGGAIPDTFDYEVRLEPEGFRVGSVHEDFAVESMAGDVFQLGNSSYRITKIEPGLVRVADAKGQPPSIPFWIAEAPGRTDALSAAVCRIRRAVEAQLVDGEDANAAVPSLPGIPTAAREQVVEFLVASQRALTAMPSDETLVLERFFDEAGGMHLVLHCPFGSRTNRAFGLALRKRFCRSFNVELQAAASDDAIVLSLGPMHAMPLDEVFSYLRPATARDVLVQALLDAPMFETRFRWNATRALAVLRMRGGKKTPAAIQRIRSNDLLAVCFPDQVACVENLSGPRQVPDHPLVHQTIEDCLHEAMDVDGMLALLSRIAEGSIRCLVRDTTEPSPLALAILNARPYAFLDDAPLEERRTQAVMQRRFLDPAAASDLGALDVDAIARVRAEVAPVPRDAEELHDALLVAVAIPAAEGRAAPQQLFDRLRDTDRASRVETGSSVLWVAAERIATVRAIFPASHESPPLAMGVGTPPTSRDDAIDELVQGFLDRSGPTRAEALASALGLPIDDARASLARFEARGVALRGSFTPGAGGDEYCERGLLARIHRLTVDRLRKAIEPVEPAVYLRFLVRHHGLHPEDAARGPNGLHRVLEQLEGFEAPAGAWEQDILPARVAGYDPSFLDQLAFSGRIAWLRRTRPVGAAPKSPAMRTAPVAFVSREALASFRSARRDGEEPPMSSVATAVRDALAANGASFLDDLARRTRLLPSAVEGGLAELVYLGLVHSDGFEGLRSYLRPAHKKPRPGRTAMPAHAGAGRWSLLPEVVASDVDRWADVLLRRYGVVSKRVLDREDEAPSWRELLHVYRRREARGDVRGGRFVAGIAGEQYALPATVPILRAARSACEDGTLVSLCGADPLNLVGHLTPDPKLARLASNRLLLRDGLPIAVFEGRSIHFLREVEPEKRRELERALVRTAAASRGRFASPHVEAAS